MLGLVCLPAVFSISCATQFTVVSEQPLSSVTVFVAESHGVPIFLDEIGKNGAFESVRGHLRSEGGSPSGTFTALRNAPNP
jgi:hypothetical protein